MLPKEKVVPIWTVPFWPFPSQSTVVSCSRFRSRFATEKRRRWRRRPKKPPRSGDSGTHRRAPGTGAGGGLVRGRRPHRPRRGVRVTNAGDAYSADAADYAVGLVVAALRHVATADAYVRHGGWAAALGEYPLAAKVPD